MSEKKILSGKLFRLPRKRVIRIIAGAATGALLGYIYYSVAGCSGSCPITSFPLNTIIFGLIIGILIAW